MFAWGSASVFVLLSSCPLLTCPTAPVLPIRICRPSPMIPLLRLLYAVNTQEGAKEIMFGRLNWKRIVAAVLAILALGTGGLALRLQTDGPQTPNAPLPRFEGYVAEPGEARGVEADNLLSMESFWNTRVSYPT